MSVTVFGYGSLLQADSIRQTCPDATNIRPALVAGIRRTFSLWDSAGLTDASHGSLQGMPYCAVNIELSKRSVTNGVIFDIDSSLADLNEREEHYLSEMAYAREIETGTEVLTRVFIAEPTARGFDFDSMAQLKYLWICLDGARSHGEKFYRAFLETTFINGAPLATFPDLLERADSYFGVNAATTS